VRGVGILEFLGRRLKRNEAVWMDNDRNCDLRVRMIDTGVFSDWGPWNRLW
jgi:hypothetical protein